MVTSPVKRRETTWFLNSSEYRIFRDSCKLIYHGKKFWQLMPRSTHPNDAGKLFDGEAFGCCFFGFLPEVSGFDNTTATLTGNRETVGRLLVAEIILLPGGNLRVACLQVRVRTGPDEHTHIGCAGNALGVAHVRSALDGERLTDGCLGVALGAVDKELLNNN